MFIHFAALVLWLATGKLPPRGDVVAKAQELRAGSVALAQHALRVLGETPDLMTQAEADFRIFLHDILFRDHNKDYKSLATCPLPQLRPFLANIIRVDGQGHASQDALVGAEYGGGAEGAG